MEVGTGSVSRLVCVAQRGEVAPRIVSVGSAERADVLAGFLDPPSPGKPLFVLESHRGFETVTGKQQVAEDQCNIRWDAAEALVGV
jgi:hypothetical protein